MGALLIASSLLALAGCATTNSAKSPLQPGTNIDAARFYTGTWYEIGRRPMSLTDGCVAGGTTYERQGGERVKVLDGAVSPTATCLQQGAITQPTPGFSP